MSSLTETQGMPRRIPAGNPGPLTGPGNNTWLLDGPVPALIDAGIGTPAHIGAIKAALGGRELACVLLTHSHDDHASGVPALQSEWPRLEVRRWTFGHEPGGFTDNERIDAGHHELRVIHTPGHAPDHVCFWNEQTGDLFGGDMMVKDSTVMIPGGRGGSLRDYLDSLQRIATLRPARILPGHGPVIETPLELIQEYIEHRRMRETQILEALNDGVSAIDAIVDRVYPDLQYGVRPAARLTVEAHLTKLREEGRLPN